jgi:hypothetical protein
MSSFCARKEANGTKEPTAQRKRKGVHAGLHAAFGCVVATKMNKTQSPYKREGRWQE